MTDETIQPGPDAPPAAETPFADQAALDQLERDAAAAAPPQPGAAPRVPLTLDSVKDDAGMYVTFALQTMAKGIEVTQGVTVNFAPKVYEEGAQRVAPLLVKYDGQIPPWFKAYKEEFFAGAWLAGVMWQVFQQLKAAKAAEQPQAKPTSA